MAEETPKEAAAAKEPKKNAEMAAAAAPGFSSPPPARHPLPQQHPRRRRIGMASLLLTVLLTVAIVLGIAVLVIWLIYRPHKPRIYVDGASIYGLNVTDGSVISNMQFTLLFQNPNRRWSVRYTRLVAFVTYRGQLITMKTPLPNLNLKRRSLCAVYAYVAGNFVPVYPDVAGGLIADEAYGLVELRLEIRGGYRLRSALWKSAHHHHHLYVTCDLLLERNGQVALLRGHRCDVDA